MYIEPNGTVYLLGNVPLEPTYEHTILFTEPSSQQNYFLTGQNDAGQGITHFPNRLKIDKTYYQRVKRGYIRLGIEMNKAILYNYMAFQNDGIRDPGGAPTGYQFENGKWYYAFITHWEYINNEVTEIQYQIDVLQTYMFDYDLLPCLIDREIPATDNLFENLVPENINFGTDYVCQTTDELDLNRMSIAMLATEAPPNYEWESMNNPVPIESGGVINGVYTPVYLFRANMQDLPISSNYYGIQANLTWFNRLIKTYVDGGKEDAIVAIFEYPNWLDYAGSEYTDSETGINVISLSLFLGDKQMDRATWATKSMPLRTEDKMIYLPTDFDGYEPVNKKLFSYPYSFAVVSNNAGQTSELKWELSAERSAPDTRIILNAEGIAFTSPCITLYPVNYRGIEQDYDSSIQLANFPECAWKGNAFAEWYAQNKNKIMFGMISTAVAGVTSSALTQSAAPTISAAQSILTQSINTIGAAQDVRAVPAQAHGKAQVDSLNVAGNHCKFSFYTMTIKREMAEIIDAYFTRYGYASHQIKVPNTNVRDHWTYTKTVGCAIKVKNGHPAIPADYVHDICQIFDNGITFWKNPKEVGDYTLDNRPPSA